MLSDIMATLTILQLQDAAPQLRTIVQNLQKKTLRIGIRIMPQSSNEFLLIVRNIPSPFVELEARFTITSDGSVTKIPFDRKRDGYSFPNKYFWGTLKEVLIEQWVDSVFLAKRLEQSKKFCVQIKRELAEKVWHPDRVAKWVEAGIQIEDL